MIRERKFIKLLSLTSTFIITSVCLSIQIKFLEGYEPDPLFFKEYFTRQNLDFKTPITQLDTQYGIRLGRLYSISTDGKCLGQKDGYPAYYSFAAKRVTKLKTHGQTRQGFCYRSTKDGNFIIGFTFDSKENIYVPTLWNLKSNIQIELNKQAKVALMKSSQTNSDWLKKYLKWFTALVWKNPENLIPKYFSCQLIETEKMPIVIFSFPQFAMKINLNGLNHLFMPCRTNIIANPSLLGDINNLNFFMLNDYTYRDLKMITKLNRQVAIFKKPGKEQCEIELKDLNSKQVVVFKFINGSENKFQMASNGNGILNVIPLKEKERVPLIIINGKEIYKLEEYLKNQHNFEVNSCNIKLTSAEHISEDGKKIVGICMRDSKKYLYELQLTSDN